VKTKPRARGAQVRVLLLMQEGWELIACPHHAFRLIKGEQVRWVATATGWALRDKKLVRRVAGAYPVRHEMTRVGHLALEIALRLREPAA
jgi:hypothetical protein